MHHAEEMATALMVKVTDSCAYLSSGGGAELHGFAATLKNNFKVGAHYTM